jgi:hypothetical protein
MHDAQLATRAGVAGRRIRGHLFAHSTSNPRPRAPRPFQRRRLRTTDLLCSRIFAWTRLGAQDYAQPRGAKPQAAAKEAAMRTMITIAIVLSGLSTAQARHIKQYLGDLPAGQQPPAVLANPYGKTLQLYDSRGRYRGNLNSNPYDPNRVPNPYSNHGSPYSPYRQDNPNNPYGGGIGVYR